MWKIRIELKIELDKDSDLQVRNQF